MRISRHELDGLATAFIERCTSRTARAPTRYDVVLIATGHDAFNYPVIRRNARLIVDARGVSASWRRTSSGPE
jgi:UDP-N-acetyl-D-mannosaminuronate dehydrogenase